MPSRSSSLAIISEVVLWATILLLVWGAANWGWGWYTRRFHEGQTISLLFRDASQLAVGSPVHFMGTDIGYVTSVKPHNGRISVEFRTYPKAVTIPEGSHFTIQFNSLAGAKTLEVLPPQTPADKKARGFIVEEPIRLRDVMKTQMILAEALESSSNNMAQSLGQVKNERNLLQRLDKVNRFMNSYKQSMTRSLGGIQHYLVKIHEYKTGSQGYMQGFAMAFARINRVTNPSYFKSQAAESVRYMAVGTEKTYHMFLKARQEQTLSRFEQRMSHVNQELLLTQQDLQKQLPHFFHGWVCFNTSLCQTDAMLGRWQDTLSRKPLKARIQSARKGIEGLNQQTRQWLERYPAIP